MANLFEHTITLYGKDKDVQEVIKDVNQIELEKVSVVMVKYPNKIYLQQRVILNKIDTVDLFGSISILYSNVGFYIHTTGEGYGEELTLLLGGVVIYSAYYNYDYNGPEEENEWLKSTKTQLDFDKIKSAFNILIK